MKLSAIAKPVLALLAGTLITFSLAPYNNWPLGLVSISLLAYLLHQCQPKQAAWLGWCYGLGMFGSGVSWVYVSIHTYGHASIVLASLLTLLFCAGLALLSALNAYFYANFLRQHPLGATLGFSAAWTLFEWLRSWLLTGFPWLYLGYGHLNSPLSGWAPVGGVFLLSFLLAYSASYLARLFISKRLQATEALSILVFWLAGWGLQGVEWTQPSDSPALKVALVQANIPQELKWRRDQYWPSLQRYQQMSEPLWPQADTVIWSEAAVPGFYDHARPFLQRMETQAKQHNSSLITGIPYRQLGDDKQLRAYNSIIALGNGEGLYHKQRLVPFGEYVPLEGLLRGLIDFFNLPMSQFSAGQGKHLLTVKDQAIAPYICYEIAYPDLVASWLPEAELLLTISNDSWFGNSIGPLQHLQMAQMRALENGRYLIRATSNGISAIVSPKGHIESRTEQFQQQVLQASVQAMTGSTPFSRTGSWPIIAISLLLCLALARQQKASNTAV